MFIPLRIRLLHNFGRTSFIIGFLIGILGLVFVLYFGFKLNWKLLLAGKNDFAPAEATITESVPTQYTVNDESLYEYHYRYKLDGKEPYEGSFLEYAGIYKNGQKIRIEYLLDSPELSRFAGTDRRNFDQIMFLGGIGSILVGFFFLYPSV